MNDFYTVKFGVLILEDKPQYMVDIVNDDMAVFYDISKKSLAEYNRRDNKELSVLSKDNRWEEHITPKKIYNSKLLNNILRKEPAEKKQIVQLYKKPLFSSDIDYHTDKLTGKYKLCFELKDTNGSPTGIYIGIDNIYILEETIDLNKWVKFDNLIYLNGGLE